jgi:hypothetical protein
LLIGTGDGILQVPANRAESGCDAPVGKKTGVIKPVELALGVRRGLKDAAVAPLAPLRRALQRLV